MLVESEKSALAITAWAQRTGIKILPIGLGGCWGWRGRIGKTESITGGRVDVMGPIPDLDVCDGRTIFVMLDANTRTNSNVQAARNALIEELRKRTCTVKACNLPQIEGVNGPDDFLSARGDDAMSKIFAEGVASEDEPEGFSDDALALRFTAKHSEDLRFTSLWGRWSKWGRPLLGAGRDSKRLRTCRQVCREAADGCGNKNIAQRVNTAATIAAVERLARSDRRHAAAVGQWNSDLWLLNTPSGAIDLRTGNSCIKSTRLLHEVHRRGPWWRLPAVAAISAYSHRRRGGLAKLPSARLWVCADGQHTRTRTLFLYGTGANGKSVFVSTVAGVLGDYSKVAPMSPLPQHRAKPSH